MTSATSAPISWTLDYGPLKVGTTYTVARAFRDFDGTEHLVGGGWLYLGHNYFAREDGLTLYVVPPSGALDTLRFQCIAEEQGPIVDALHEYLVPGPVALDHAAFARALAAAIRGDANALHRQLALEVVARMPVVPDEIAAAVVDKLVSGVPADESVQLLMALYNLGEVAAPHRARVVELREHARDDTARAIADAVLNKL